VDGWPHIFLVSNENIASDQEITTDCDDEYNICRARAENIHTMFCAQEALPVQSSVCESHGTNSDSSQNDILEEDFCGGDEDESESEDMDEKRALEERMYSENEVMYVCCVVCVCTCDLCVLCSFCMHMYVESMCVCT
jgi:hypothetical protein